MKKILCMALVLLMLVGATASAEVNKYEGTITFRGIPWGTSFTEASTEFSKAGINIRSFMGSTYGSVQKIIEQDVWGYSEYDTYGVSWTKPDGLVVAGIEPTQVNVYFAYRPNAEGNIDPDDKDNMVFMLAYYKFEPTDLEAATADMRTKLEKLYGDIDYTSSDDLVIKRHYDYWLATDNTFVCLEDESYSTGTKAMYVWYGTLDADEWLKEANQIQYDAAKAEEASKFGSDDTDGL